MLKITFIDFHLKKTFPFTSNRNRILNDLMKNNDTSQTPNRGFEENFLRFNGNKTKILHELGGILKCSQTDLNLIYYNHVNQINELKMVRQNVKFLRKKSVSLSAIVNSPAVLIMPLGNLLFQKKKITFLNKFFLSFRNY